MVEKKGQLVEIGYRDEVLWIPAPGFAHQPQSANQLHNSKELPSLHTIMQYHVHLIKLQSPVHRYAQVAKTGGGGLSAREEMCRRVACMRIYRCARSVLDTRRVFEKSRACSSCSQSSGGHGIDERAFLVSAGKMQLWLTRGKYMQ